MLPSLSLFQVLPPGNTEQFRQRQETVNLSVGHMGDLYNKVIARIISKYTSVFIFQCHAQLAELCFSWSEQGT